MHNFKTRISTGTDAVCLSSFKIDNQPVLFGPNQDMTHFWIFGHNTIEHRCYAEGDYDSTNGKWWGMRYRELIVKNGKVENSFKDYECDTDERTVGLDASLCVGKFNELNKKISKSDFLENQKIFQTNESKK